MVKEIYATVSCTSAAPIPFQFKRENPTTMKEKIAFMAERQNSLFERQNKLHSSMKTSIMPLEGVLMNIGQKIGMTKEDLYHTPNQAENAQCLSHKGSCTPIASVEIPEGDHDCMLYLNKPFRVVTRGRVYHTVAGDSLNNMTLRPKHGKVSIGVVQRHKEDSALPVPNEQANLYSLRDVIGTYVAWPLSLINLRPKVAPSSGKGLGKETSYSKESIAGPSSKGSTGCVSSEILKLAEAQGAAYLDMMKLFVRSDQTIDTATIQLTSEQWGKEFCDIVGKENIIEVIHRHWLSASTINFYIRYLCEAYLHGIMANRFSFISLYEMDEALNPNQHQHIAEMLKRHMGEDHLIFAPYNVG
ncbi:uncharacterized protein LOC113859338 [Abrus precatorius]|uniref:Uncharacterized protein LOC113859338 n=1 Tax=Abrus precatorius TaxID=3816 RepID=A0A8B8KX70_ABRPR|nr:uncharacterized protein LOC113859338 [Abrus precatorius]